MNTALLFPYQKKAKILWLVIIIVLVLIVGFLIVSYGVPEIVNYFGSISATSTVEQPNINLNTDIFKDPRYPFLKDYQGQPVTDPVGRPHPFEPF